MKKLLAFFSLLVFSLACIAAQEAETSADLFDWDIDSLFDEPWPESPAGEDEASSVLDAVKQRGLTFSASYEFQGGIAPGWDTSPWFFDGNEVFTWGQGVKMNASFSIDAQISEVFRARTVFNLNIPGSWLSLGDFFFDYNFLNAVFVRAGKYEHSWGISPNYGFTNLLARVPDASLSGTSYIFKTDIPIGIGGFQALALTRADIMGGVTLSRNDIGFGGKYNLAFRWADFDMGVFYQKNMALRGFLSVKTTVANTELYNEWLLAVNTHSDNETSFAVNLGFARDFFNEKISVNGEFFYNGEGSTYFYRAETSLRDADTIEFIEDINMALNFLYRFSGKGDPRFFVQMKYMPAKSSAQLVPGFKITPLSHIEIYLAVPMALGGKTGYYYQHTEDPNNRPFSIMLLVTLKGSVQAAYNY